MFGLERKETAPRQLRSDELPPHNDPTPPPVPQWNPELEAMAQIHAQLAVLDGEARRRALRWICDSLEIDFTGR